MHRLRIDYKQADEPNPHPVRLILSLTDPIKTKQPSILDFDVETVAAGFADPNWVPQKITCVAWSYVGSDKVESRICGPAGIYGNPEKRAAMLNELLTEINQADMLTGHNIARFDLPVINAEAMRLGLEPIRKALVQDTMKVLRAKGFKKGQDNLGRLFNTTEQKLALDWQAWQDAYDEDGWKTIRRRAESDVLMHKQLRAKLLERGYLKPPQTWRST
jgi:DNA polymerase elongation subunit (family B)